MRLELALAAGVLLACSSSSTTSGPGGGGPIACAGDAGCPDGYLCTSSVCTRTSTDGRAPTVVTVTPTPNDENVWVGAPIVATFSEPMRLGDGDASVDMITAGGAVAKTLDLSPDGRTLTIHAPELAGPADVLIHFGAGFTDQSGLTVSSYGVPSWRFGCPQWQAPGGTFPQESTPYGLSSGAVTVDAAGRGVAAFLWMPTATDHALRVHRWEGNAWVQKLDRAVGADDYVSEVGLAARGDAIVLAYGHAAWGATTSSVEVGTFLADAWTWLPTLTISGGGAPNVRVAMGPDLAPVVAWTDGSALHASRWDPVQTAWSALADIPKGSTNASIYLGDVRVDGAGVVHAAYYDSTGYVGTIWVVQWKAASADPVGGAPTSDANPCHPSLALGPSGNPLVAYEKTGMGFGVSRFDGASWSETLTVPPSGSSWRFRPSVAVDPVLGVFAAVETGSSIISTWHDGGSGWVEEDWMTSPSSFADATLVHLADGVGTGPWTAYMVGSAFNVKRYNHR